MRTQASPFTFSIGTLGTFNLFAGDEVQLAQVGEISLLAKETTLLQTETDIIAEINANETKIDAIKTKTDSLENTDLT